MSNVSPTRLAIAAYPCATPFQPLKLPFGSARTAPLARRLPVTADAWAARTRARDLPAVLELIEQRSFGPALVKMLPADWDDAPPRSERSTKVVIDRAALGFGGAQSISNAQAFAPVA